MQRPKFCPQCTQPLTESPQDAQTRLSCPDSTCGYVFWDNPTPVVAAIVETPSGVVLARNVGWPESWFGLVTGFLERDETAEQGVVREVAEELGLDATIAGFVGNYSFFQQNQLILAYHLTAEGEITLNEELAAYKIVPVEKLRPWPFATGDAVRDWLARR